MGFIIILKKVLGAKLRLVIEIEKNAKSIQIHLYACVIGAKNFFFTWTIVSHLPRDISCHVFFFMKEKGVFNGFVLSAKNRASPIPSEALEIPLMLKFSCSMLDTFIKSLYEYDFTVSLQDECDEEIDLLLQKSRTVKVSF